MSGFNFDDIRAELNAQIEEAAAEQFAAGARELGVAPENLIAKEAEGIDMERVRRLTQGKLRGEQ